MRKLNYFALVHALLMLFVVLVTLYPFYYMLVISLSGQAFVLRGDVFLWPKGFNLGMYEYVVKDGRIFTGYKNTLIFVTLGTAISLLLTSMGAYALSKKTMVLSKTFMILIVITIFFQGGMIPTFLVVKQLGLVNTICVHGTARSRRHVEFNHYADLFREYSQGTGGIGQA
ncbi:hypothetical protein ACHHV8_22760 [Paenibacillus sp. TAB 01]|uniref:hypothetical protein n=1 Tax=Paenibacillus sp. TAB 01 TaxID=3368988 RepID=UPI003750000D